MFGNVLQCLQCFLKVWMETNSTSWINPPDMFKNTLSTVAPPKMNYIDIEVTNANVSFVLLSCLSFCFSCNFLNEKLKFCTVAFNKKWTECENVVLLHFNRDAVMMKKLEMQNFVVWCNFVLYWNENQPFCGILPETCAKHFLGLGCVMLGGVA